MTTIACSHCGTKYKVDPARFTSLTPKIRCKKCEKVFEADLREPASAAPAAAAVSAAPAPTPVAAAPRPMANPAPAPTAGTGGLAVLFAHESAPIRERIAQVAREGGLQCTTVDNGVEALVQLQSGRYQVGVLDVALPRMFGFEVCEVIRRDASLDHVKLLLIAAIYDQNRYRRPPSTLYGADGYIEKQDLDVEFVKVVRAAMQVTAPDAAQATPAAAQAAPAAPAPVAPAVVPQRQPVAPPTAAVSQPVAATPAAAAQAPAVATPVTPAVTPSAAPAASLAGVEPKDLERARRLGRVIVSDLALYNKEIFATAQSPEEIYNALQKDIQDSREQINNKIAAVIREAEDVLDIAVRGYIEKRNAKK